MFDGSRHELVRYQETPAPEEDGRLVIFHHIPKCGGVTFSHLMDLAFGERHFGRINHAWQWPLLAASGFVRDERAQAAVSGHASWGVHALFPGRRRAFYFTMLRDPFSMCVSEFRYARMQYGGAADFGEFMRGPYMADMAVRYLGNGDLELAKARLEEAYFLFGLVERYDESVRLFNRLLGLPDRRFPRKNASAASFGGGEEAYREEFEEKNRLDRRLYDFARKLFDVRAISVLENAPGETLTAPDPDRNPACLEAVASERAGDPETAYALLRTHEDRSPAACRGLARYAARLGRPEEELSWLREGAARHPDMFRDLAWRLEGPGDAAGALAALDSWLAAIGDCGVSDPPDASYNRDAAQTLVDKARLLFALGRSDEAMEAYRQAHALDFMRWTPRYEGAALGGEIPVREALSGTGRLLVLRFGPMPAFAALFEDLAGLSPVPAADAVVQRALAGVCDRRDVPGEEILIPDGRFRFEPSMAARLAGRGYGAVALVVNLDGLERFAEPLRLALALAPALGPPSTLPGGGGRIFLYPMRNAFLEKSARALVPVPLEMARAVANIGRGA